MKTRSTGMAVAAILCVAGISAGVNAKGTDARQLSLSPMTCTAGGTGTVGFNKSGSRVTVNFAATNAAASGWTVTATDAVAGVVARTIVSSTSSTWSSIATYNSPKGIRTVTVTAVSADGSNTCAGSISYKV